MNINGEINVITVYTCDLIGCNKELDVTNNIKEHQILDLCETKKR